MPPDTPLFTDFQPIAAIALTPAAVQRLQPLCQSIGATLWVPESLADQTGVRGYSGSLHTHLQTLWSSQRSLIFSLATGAVVRLIAPLLSDKLTDPAIVVVDTQAKFVISLCSGHVGQSDALTRRLADYLGATPVITGAAATAGLTGIDILGRSFGWLRGGGDWTGVSGAMARRETVQVVQTAGSILWHQTLPPDHPFIFVDEATVRPAAQVWITEKRSSDSSLSIPQVYWHPRVLWVGIGCERGTSRRLIETSLEEICNQSNLAEASIAGIATVDLKANEVGLLDLCHDRAWPLQCFRAEILKQIPVPNPSPIVDQAVGTPSVAEAAAFCAAQQLSRLTDTPAQLIVPKQIFRSEAEPGAVTLAIALAGAEYTGRGGKLWLIGTGPGAVEQITPAAHTAIAGADVVIGYSLYIDLLRTLFSPGQIIEPYAITAERQRAERAIALARWGLTVAVVSSGDAGIYGMAGLVLEELQQQGWDGKDPEVEVFPGISALQSAAARVGTPLMHDFCAISLSDRLTPWPVIETRLQAAAQADFVTALYNPRSQTRIEQLKQAQQIFLQHRQPDTPVAIVRCAYRQEEEAIVTSLSQLLEVEIDMLTIIIIGNLTTRLYNNWMITPRGYLGFGK